MDHIRVMTPETHCKNTSDNNSSRSNNQSITWIIRMLILRIRLSNIFRFSLACVWSETFGYYRKPHFGISYDWASGFGVYSRVTQGSDFKQLTPSPLLETCPNAAINTKPHEQTSRQIQRMPTYSFQRGLKP